jgi:hypothetical protein
LHELHKCLKPTFKNYHKQEIHIAKQICSENKHNGQQPIKLRTLGKSQGKSQCGETQQEGERERSYYAASGKYITTTKS